MPEDEQDGPPGTWSFAAARRQRAVTELEGRLGHFRERPARPHPRLLGDLKFQSQQYTVHDDDTGFGITFRVLHHPQEYRRYGNGTRPIGRTINTDAHGYDRQIAVEFSTNGGFADILGYSKDALGAKGMSVPLIICDDEGFFYNHSMYRDHKVRHPHSLYVTLVESSKASGLEPLQRDLILRKRSPMSNMC